jgi:hypothetical protein
MSQAPHQLPDLRRVDLIAIDTETRDAGLQAGRGSSWAWGDGHIAGISIAWHAGGEMRRQYIPLRHPDSDNFDIAQTYSWLGDLIAAGARFVTLNGVYDFGWLRAEGGLLMPPSRQLEEVGALAVTVNENLNRYSLDALCEHHGLAGKDEALLHQAVEAAGLAPKRKKKINVKNHIWQLPARYVGPYAEADAVATLGCLKSSTLFWIRKAPAKPIGSKLICNQWSWRCALVASGSIRTPPNRLAIF